MKNRINDGRFQIVSFQSFVPFLKSLSFFVLSVFKLKTERKNWTLLIKDKLKVRQYVSFFPKKDLAPYSNQLIR